MLKINSLMGDGRLIGIIQPIIIKLVPPWVHTPWGTLLLKMTNKSKLEIKYLDIKTLKFAKYNPRQISKKQFADLKQSITEFGFVEPVLVNTHPERKNTIIGGHMRVRVAKDIGMTTVPCVFASYPLAKEKEINIRLNKNNGEFDFETLANEFDHEDLIGYGFTEDELLGKSDPIDLEEDETKLTGDSKTHTCPECGCVFK